MLHLRMYCFMCCCSLLHIAYIDLTQWTVTAQDCIIIMF